VLSDTPGFDSKRIRTLEGCQTYSMKLKRSLPRLTNRDWSSRVDISGNPYRGAGSYWDLGPVVSSQGSSTADYRLKSRRDGDKI